MLDVPFFFFLSGWGSSYCKNDIKEVIKGIGKIWAKWIYFISVLSIVCFMTRYLPIKFASITSFKELISNYMFQVSFPDLPVVSGSIWFMQWYFLTIFINTIVLNILEKNKKNYNESKKIYCIILIFLFIWISYGFYFFDINNYIIFYSVFWMIGQIRNEININSIKKLFIFLIIIVIGYFITGYLFDIPFYDIQTAKFPPTIIYGFASLVIIIIAIYLEPHVKKYNKFLVHVGKNAIFYFFAQGIGSSLNYYIVENVNASIWFSKWIITYLCNIIITVIIAESLAYTYKLLENLIIKAQNKK